MKKLIFYSLATILTVAVIAQPGNKPVYKPAAKTPVPQIKTVPQVPLKNIEDSIGYVFGINVGNFYKNSGIKKLNTAIITKSINDFLADSALLMNTQFADSYLNSSIPRLKAIEQKNKQVLLIQNKVATDPVKKVVALKGYSDTLGYAVGVSIANFFRQFGITKVQTNATVQAITDILVRKKQLFTDNDANVMMNAYISKLQAEKAELFIREGNAFLEQNKTRPEVKTTASGLQYEVLKDTTGEKPLAVDTVTVHYRGYYINGTDFDNSYTRGQPISFAVKGVIPGWTEGLQLMSVGSKYRFFIPYTLGYGATDYMSIPGGSTLLFDVELLGIKRAVTAPVKPADIPAAPPKTE